MEDKKTPIPDSIDHYIHSGIQKGKRRKKIKKRVLFSTISSIAFILLFITSVRVSPALANTMKNVPWMEGIIALIQGDQGLKDAISHDYLHEIDVWDTQEGLTFSVDQIIVDQARMILFYSISTTDQHEYVRLTNLQLLNQNRETIKAAIEYSDFDELVNLQETKRMQGKITVTFAEEEIVPEKISLSTQLEAIDAETVAYMDGKLLDSNWNLEIPIAEEWYENTREIITIEQTIKMQQQQIHIEKAVINPTLISLEIKFDEDNDMQLLKFDDLKLVDDRGDVWEPIKNGITSMGEDNEFSLFFQSNYFRKPQELFLTGSSIRAIPSEEQEVVIDLQEKRLVMAPSDRRIQLEQVHQRNNQVELEFIIQMDDRDKEHLYEIFDSIPVNFHHDIHYANVGMSRTDEESPYMIYYYTIDSPTNMEKIILKIIDYPHRIVEPFSLKIK